jgi:hypothetical protein
VGWARPTAVLQGGSSQFPGVLVGPPHVSKCHQPSNTKCHQNQKSTEHIQHPTRPGRPLAVGSLAHPPGHPAAGRCVRAVPVPPLLLCTRPARARSSAFDRGQRPWGPPRAWCSGRLADSNSSSWLIRPSGPKSRSRGTMHFVAVRRVARDPVAAKRSNGRWRMGLFQLPLLEWEPTGASLGLFHRI